MFVFHHYFISQLWPPASGDQLSIYVSFVHLLYLYYVSLYSVYENDCSAFGPLPLTNFIQHDTFQISDGQLISALWHWDPLLYVRLLYGVWLVQRVLPWLKELPSLYILRYKYLPYVRQIFTHVGGEIEDSGRGIGVETLYACNSTMK